jgi:hypothetical protein
MIDDLSARIASLAPGKSAKEDLEPVAAILAKHSAMKAEMCTHFKEEYDVGLLLVRKGMTCKQVSSRAPTGVPRDREDGAMPTTFWVDSATDQQEFHTEQTKSATAQAVEPPA